MVTYDLDRIVDRRNTDCLKYLDKYKLKEVVLLKIYKIKLRW